MFALKGISLIRQRLSGRLIKQPEEYSQGLVRLSGGLLEEASADVKKHPNPANHHQAISACLRNLFSLAMSRKRKALLLARLVLAGITGARLQACLSMADIQRSKEARRGTELISRQDRLWGRPLKRKNQTFPICGKTALNRRHVSWQIFYSA